MKTFPKDYLLVTVVFIDRKTSSSTLSVWASVSLQTKNIPCEINKSYHVSLRVTGWVTTFERCYYRHCRMLAKILISFYFWTYIFLKNVWMFPRMYTYLRRLRMSLRRKKIISVPPSSVKFTYPLFMKVAEMYPSLKYNVIFAFKYPAFSPLQIS